MAATTDTTPNDTSELRGAPTPDTAVFAACAAFDAADRHCEAVVNETFEWRHDHDPTPDSVQRTAMHSQVARAEELAAMKPATLAGHAARAASALGSSLRFGSDGPDDAVSSDDALNYVPGGLVPAIVRDLAELATATAIDPDAELIRLCAHFDDLERRIRGISGSGGSYAHLALKGDRAVDAATAPLSVEQDALLDRICAFTATTLAGHQARAHSLALWAPDLLEDGEGFGGVMEVLTAALLRDLMPSAVAV